MTLDGGDERLLFFSLRTRLDEQEWERKSEREWEALVETDFTIDSNYSFVLLHDSTPNSTLSSRNSSPLDHGSLSLFSPLIGVSRNPSSMQETTARAFESILCRYDKYRCDVSLHGDYTFDAPSFQRSCCTAGFPSIAIILPRIYIAAPASFWLPSF